MHGRGLPLHLLAWTAALLPCLSTHVSFLISASQGLVEWCNPYWAHCSSISATGREMPASLWFKALMIPSALITAGLWWSAAGWRRAAGATRFHGTLAALPWTGTVAALCLILYTVALGEAGDMNRIVRRGGVVLAFALTYITQVLCTRLLGEVAQLRRDARLGAWHRRLFVLLGIQLGVGVLSVILDGVLGRGYDAVENGFEWVMALLLYTYFAGLALAWRREGAVLAIRLPPRP